MMYMPNSRWSWAFMLITLVQAAIVLAFEAYVFAIFQIKLTDENENKDAATAIPTFLALYIFGFIYQLILTYDALHMRNTIQIIGLVLLNIGLLIYGGVQLDTIQNGIESLDEGSAWNGLRPFLIAIPCILAFCTACLAFVAWKLYDEFAWTIYKRISADLRMKRRYLTYQIYIALLKFDFFFFLGFTIQFIVIVHRTNTERGLTIAAIPVTIAILFAAAWFTRREILAGMIGVLVLFLAGLAYFIFKLYRMYDPNFSQPYQPARRELTTFAVITIVLIVVTIVYACMCIANFNKGLKPYVSKIHSPDDEEKTGFNGGTAQPYTGAPGSYGYGQGMEMHDSYGKPARVAPTRMEID